MPTSTHLCVHIFLYINAFCALTCLLSVQINQTKSKKKIQLLKEIGKQKGKRTSRLRDLSEKRRERESRIRKK